MKIEIQYLQGENADLNFKLAQVEDKSKNLRIEGLCEGQNDALVQSVVSVFTRTGIACSETDIDYARRVGKYQEGYTRPVLVRLVHESKRNQILYNRTKVNKNKPPNTPLVWINDEVSDETSRLRKTVRDISTLAKINGNDNIKVHSDGVILDNDKFHLNDLDLLPPRISVDQAKSRTDETDIFFQGENSPFSNFYTAKFTDNEGYIYHSTEQAFFHKKARAHGKHQIASKIMKTRNPYEVKRLPKKIPTNQEWSTGELSLMETIVYNKFEQNEPLTAILINTGDHQLHKASADKKWGTGAELSSKALLQGEWTGEDQLGQILESVREKLKVKYPSLPQADTPTYGLALDDEVEDLTPLPEEAVIDMPIQSSQATQPSPRAKPITDPQPKGTIATQVNTEPQQQQSNAQQQAPANKSKGRNRGGKKVQVTGNQPGTSQQDSGAAAQAVDQVPSPPPRGNRRARAQTRASLGQGSEH